MLAGWLVSRYGPCLFFGSMMNRLFHCPTSDGVSDSFARALSSDDWFISSEDLYAGHSCSCCTRGYHCLVYDVPCRINFFLSTSFSFCYFIFYLGVEFRIGM